MREAVAQDKRFAWEFLANCLGRARGSARGSCAMSLDSLDYGLSPSASTVHVTAPCRVSAGCQLDTCRALSMFSSSYRCSRADPTALRRGNKKKCAAFHFGTGQKSKNPARQMLNLFSYARSPAP